MNIRRLLLLAALAALVLTYFGLDLGRFLSLDYFKSQQAAIEALQQLRWSGASSATAADVRARLRAAFKTGPKLRNGSTRGEGGVLPPLYPVR